MIDYNYIITKTKEELITDQEIVDIDSSFLHFVFPFIESVEIDYLNDCNENIPAKDIKTTGYYCNIEENYISIYLSCFDQFIKYGKIIPEDTFNEFKNSISNLIQIILNNSYKDLNESQPIYDLCDYIASHPKVEIIYNIITNYTVPLTYEKDGNYSIKGKEFGIRTYDINDIIDKINSNYESNHELNLIEKFGKGIPAVLISSSKDVDVYLTSFVGDWIAQLYKEDSIGLLSANVRSYLKRTNKVNREIITTIKESPQEFVAYNNGLSAIASGVEVVDSNDSSFAVIKKISDFLIVNGGQTTASLYECKNDKIDLSSITVPAKLSVIKNQLSSEYLISNISVYSNSQTAIKKSDPPSNSRFYKTIEELSKSIMARKNVVEYHCFFERTNGQYNTLKRMHSLKSDPFKAMNPEKSKFNKLQLAQAIVSWEQKPDLVCKGQENNFEFFNGIVNSLSPTVINEDYFKGGYALIILYRKLDALIKKEKLPYKSSLVTYTLAFLSLKCEKRLDLMSIWNNQEISYELQNLLLEMIYDVYNKIIESPKNQPDIRMWSRRPECWSHVKEIDKEYSINLFELAWEFFPENNAKLFIDSNFNNVQMWKDLDSWVKENDIALSQKQIQMIHGMPAIIYKGKVTKRQEAFAKSIFLSSVELGYNFDKTF